MDKIEPNEYIKTRDGKIGIFDRYSSRKETSLYKSPFNCFIRLLGRKTPLQCDRQYIIKHSKNIIDLIEVGDIVYTYDVLNYDVIYIYDDEMLKAIKQDIEQGIKIKKIWTKEQLKSIEYNVN